MITQAFIHEPDVVFIDEPLANLEPLVQEQVKQYLVSYAAGRLVTERSLSGDGDDAVAGDSDESLLESLPRARRGRRRTRRSGARADERPMTGVDTTDPVRGAGSVNSRSGLSTRRLLAIPFREEW